MMVITRSGLEGTLIFATGTCSKLRNTSVRQAGDQRGVGGRRLAYCHLSAGNSLVSSLYDEDIWCVFLLSSGNVLLI